MRFYRFAAVAVLFLLLVFPAMAGVDVKPGKWEVSIEMSMPGMPMGNMQPEPFTYCLTPEDLIPVNKEETQECEITDVRTEGNTVSWRIKCAAGEGGVMEGSGWITYKHTEFSGVMEVNMDIPGHGDMKMTQKYKGKYLGECAE